MVTSGRSHLRTITPDAAISQPHQTLLSQNPRSAVAIRPERQKRGRAARAPLFKLQAVAPTPIGQLTPVPPSPQYPAGFLARYCWW